MSSIEADKETMREEGPPPPAPLGRCDNCANKIDRRRRNVIRQLRIGSSRRDQEDLGRGEWGRGVSRQEQPGKTNRLCRKSHTQNKKARSADLQAVISLLRV